MISAVQGRTRGPYLTRSARPKPSFGCHLAAAFPWLNRLNQINDGYAYLVSDSRPAEARG